MRFSIMRCLTLYFLLFNVILFGHGFGTHTLVALADGSKKTIYTVCLQTLKNKPFVISYDPHKCATLTQQVKIGKKSKTNCYFRLGFDSNCKHSDDILCTPSQEFYLLDSQTWVPAYKLKIGDALLSKDLTTKKLTYKEFVPKPLNIYMLEIENSHTFFVGKYSLLTHNIFLPVTASIGFVVPFGSTAAGTAGGFFGPIGLVAGLTFGSLISFVAKVLYEKRIPRYKSPEFDISFIQSNCHNLNFSHQNNKTKQSGCFQNQELTDISCSYPIENPLPHISTGCIEI